MKFAKIIFTQLHRILGIIFIVIPGFSNQAQVQLTDLKSVHETVNYSIDEIFSALSLNGNSELKIYVNCQDQEILLRSLQKSIVDYLGCGLKIVNKETVDSSLVKFDSDSSIGIAKFRLEDAIEYIRLDQFSDENFRDASQDSLHF